MTLDNRATDGQTDPHTAALGCVERFEESAHVMRVEPHTCILHGEAHTVVFVALGFDHQVPWPILDTAHRVRGVQEQVQNHLLKLDTVARDRREVVR
jgi:hypothetical protein